MTEQERIKTLRQEIRHMQVVAERKNTELSGLHMVWCDGGCGQRLEEVTPEMVSFVEGYAKRLRAWFINHAGREAAPHGGWNGGRREEAWKRAEAEIDAA